MDEPGCLKAVYLIFFFLVIGWFSVEHGCSMFKGAIHYVSHPGGVVRVINDPAPAPTRRDETPSAPSPAPSGQFQAQSTKREETPSAPSPAPSGQFQAQSSEVMARTAEPLVAPDDPQCADRKRLRSRAMMGVDDNPEDIKVTFYNNSPAQATMKFWWIDPQGQEKYFQTLAHGQWHTQPTHADEVWLATDATTGSCLAVITTRKGVDPILSVSKSP